ncbi:MAG: tRNA (N6-isopentenyl adenosine(37)-C2)-methylthiotransferase MiaB [Patescibacteria group bacterium]
MNNYSTMPGTYKLTTLGCQMNKSDSERIKGLLEKIGMRETDDSEGADVLIYNTCSVRQKSEDRIYGLQAQFEVLKQKNPSVIIAVTGCMPGRDRDGVLRERLEYVDLFFPTEEIVLLPKRLSELRSDIIDPNSIANYEYKHYLDIQPSYQSLSQAFVPISNGCNKFCTYCVVPYARGKQKDRPLRDILDEVRSRADQGCKEITLLGQTVNLYNPPDKEYFSLSNPFDHSKNGFAALIWELNECSGIERIHFTAPHPQYMDNDTLDALCLPKQMNYVHLPVQSGSNAVLKRMNRPYTAEYYCERITELKKRKPTTALGTDIIVGFCGETDQDFQQTVELYTFCDFDIAYLAMYSVRSGTAAHRMYKDDISKNVKKERWCELQKIMEEIVLKKNQRYVGEVVSVLVDSFDKGMCSGNSREMKRVQFKGQNEFLGTLCDVKIDRALEWVLYGTKV